MQGKLIYMITFMLVSQLFIAGMGLAEISNGYNSDNDITLSVTLLEDYIETDDSTGEFTFETQESAHILIEDEADEEVEHFYIWVKVNNSKVLAIDPPRPMMN